MSDTGIGDLSTDEVHDAIRQGVFDAFAGLLVNSPFDSPRGDLLLSVENGVAEAFRNMVDAAGSYPFTRADILASIQEGTRQAAVERNNEEEN